MFKNLLDERFLLFGTPGRARTDTGALLGGSPLPLGYGGAEIVPHRALFIQTFCRIGQETIISYQVDISHPHNCAVACAIPPLLVGGSRQPAPAPRCCVLRWCPRRPFGTEPASPALCSPPARGGNPWPSMPPLSRAAAGARSCPFSRGPRGCGPARRRRRASPR
jgi:hypothetical protein